MNDNTETSAEELVSGGFGILPQSIKDAIRQRAALIKASIMLIIALLGVGHGSHTNDSIANLVVDIGYAAIDVLTPDHAHADMRDMTVARFTEDGGGDE